jgi:hypothetical protein
MLRISYLFGNQTMSRRIAYPISYMIKAISSFLAKLGELIYLDMLAHQSLLDQLFSRVMLAHY